MAEHAFIVKRGVVTEVVGDEVIVLHRTSDVFGCEGVTAVRLGVVVRTAQGFRLKVSHFRF